MPASGDSLPACRGATSVGKGKSKVYIIEEKRLANALGFETWRELNGEEGPLKI